MSRLDAELRANGARFEWEQLDPPKDGERWRLDLVLDWEPEAYRMHFFAHTKQRAREAAEMFLTLAARASRRA